ncbi:MAG: hypothetical protein K6G22_09370 [Lachnospiraceae bacterium]|nr:hypothetical protein [Lachnospiraceae bacterium]
MVEELKGPEAGNKAVFKNAKMLEVGNIVSIENGKEYMLSERIYHNGKLYFYAYEADSDDNLKNSVIIEGRVVDGEEYVVIVEDMEVQQEILGIIKNGVRHLSNREIRNLVVRGILIVLCVVFCFILPVRYTWLPGLAIGGGIVMVGATLGELGRVRKINRKTVNNDEDKTW